MTELERLQVVIEANTKPLQQELNKISGEMDGLEKTVSRSTGRMKSSFAELTVAVTAVGYAAKKAANLISDLGQEAISVQAQSNNLQRTLGENANSFIEWAKTGAEAYGISESAAIRYGNTFAGIIRNFETDTSKMGVLTQQMLETSAIVASKTGRTMDDVLTKIRSGLWGNTQAIDDLGINVKQSALVMTDAYKQIAGDQSWNQLNFNQQQAILYFAILEQASATYGNSLDPAMQKQLMMAASLENLKLRLGEAFVPILQFVIPVIQHMIKWLTIAANAITSFFAIFSGKKGAGATSGGVGGIIGGGAKASESIASSLGNASNSANTIGSGLKGAAGSADKVSKGIAKGTKEAKKIKTLLSGFDQLNIMPEAQGVPQITSPAISGAGGIGGIGGGGVSVPALDFGAIDTDGLFSGLNSELDVLDDRFDGISQVVAGLALAIGGMWAVSKVSKFIGSIKDLLTNMGFLKGVTDNADAGMSNFRNGLGLTLVGIAGLLTSVGLIITSWDEMDTLQQVLVIGLAGLSGAMIAVGVTAMATGTTIAAAMSAATLGIGALIGIGIGLAASIVNWVVESEKANAEMKDVALQAENLETALDNLRNATNDNISAVDRYEDSLKALEEAEKKNQISGKDLQEQVDQGVLSYEDMTAEQREVYKAYRNNLDAEEELNDSREQLTQATKDATIADFKHRLSLAHSTGNYEEYKDSVVAAYKDGQLSAEEARDLIEGAMSDMSTASRETFQKDLPADIKEGLDPNKYSTTSHKLKNSFSDTWEAIKNKAGEMWDKIKEIFGSVSTWLDDNLVTPIKDAWKGLWNTIADVGNSIIGGIESMINGIIGGLNGMIRAMNKLHFSVPSWVPLIGGKSFGFNLSEISKRTLSRIPKYEVGTNYVPNDGLAYLHKGEAVVPKKYNPALSGDNNKEQIALLVEQNKLLTAILNKETDIRLDGQKVNQTLSKADYRRQRSLGLAR